MIFGKAIISALRDNGVKIFENNFGSEIIVQSLISFITFLLFLFIYVYISKPLKYRKIYIGALFASISLNIISFFFSKYLEIFKGFSIMYGSLTTLILIMMWTYSCFYVIFLGAEINKFYNEIKRRKM